MSEKENKQLVRRHYEAANRHDEEGTYAVVAEDGVFHMPSGDLSVAQAKAFDKMFITAFPDISYTVEEMIAEGDLVAFRVKVRGTNRGPLQGRPASGRTIEFTNSNWFRVAGGKLAEYWAFSDRLAIMQQLGLATDNI